MGHNVLLVPGASCVAESHVETNLLSQIKWWLCSHSRIPPAVDVSLVLSADYGLETMLLGRGGWLTLISLLTPRSRISRCWSSRVSVFVWPFGFCNEETLDFWHWAKFRPTLSVFGAARRVAGQSNPASILQVTPTTKSTRMRMEVPHCRGSKRPWTTSQRFATSTGTTGTSDTSDTCCTTPTDKLNFHQGSVSGFRVSGGGRGGGIEKSVSAAELSAVLSVSFRDRIETSERCHSPTNKNPFTVTFYRWPLCMLISGPRTLDVEEALRNCRGFVSKQNGDENLSSRLSLA